MKQYFFTLILLFTTIIGFSSLSYAQEKIPLLVAKSGHIGIKAKVNGVEGTFIFDTGAGITVLTKKFSEKLTHLQKGDGMLTAFRATGERMDVDLYKAEEVQIGSFVDKAPTLTILDADILGCDGLISLMHFTDQPITLDLQNKVLLIETAKSLAQRRSAGVAVPLFLNQNRELALDMFIPVLLNKKVALFAMLDSGGGENSLWINGRYMAACGVDISDTAHVKKVVRKSDYNKELETVFYKAIVPELSVQNKPGMKTENFGAVFTHSLIYDAKVSIGWLGDVLTFDLRNKELIVRK